MMNAHGKASRQVGALAILIATLSAGCISTRTARLYDLDTASILQLTYRGHARGILEIARPDRSVCSGEYSAVTRSEMGWGAIYSGVKVAQGISIVSENESRGQAVATCEDGTVFECEFVAGEGGGHGACRDNQMHRYRLMF